MSVELNGTKVTLDLWSLLESANPDQLATLVDALACQKSVIREVVSLMEYGATSLGSWPADEDMQEAREHLLGVLDTVRLDSLKHLLAENAELRRDREYARLLAYSWPGTWRDAMPKRPDRQEPRTVEQYEADRTAIAIEVDG